MTFRYYKSELGIQEYQKVGKPYPDHIQDQLWQHHVDLIKWDPDKTEFVNGITRVKRHDGSEWLVYAATSEGHDSVYGKRHSFFRSNLGRYVSIRKEVIRVPNPDFATSSSSTDLDFNLDGSPKDVSKASMYNEVTNIVGERDAYSIPFTKENLDELHKKCRDEGPNREEITSYYVEREGGMTIHITGSYQDFRNGNFEELYAYGAILPKEEKYRIDSLRANQGRGNSNNIPTSTPTMMSATEGVIA